MKHLDDVLRDMVTPRSENVSQEDWWPTFEEVAAPDHQPQIHTNLTMMLESAGSMTDPNLRRLMMASDDDAKSIIGLARWIFEMGITAGYLAKERETHAV